MNVRQAPLCDPLPLRTQPGISSFLDLVDVGQARRLVEQGIRPVPVDWIALSQARGRVLGSPIHADADIVPFARSAMDGYAVRALDVASACGNVALLRVGGDVYAQRGTHGHLAGTATAVATGAPLPCGADAVVPIEAVDRQGDYISITRTVTTGDHIFPPGEDAKKGQLLIAAGQRLHAGSLALLASAGIHRLPVFRRVRVAIVCTGDELVPIETAPAPGQIRNSNGLMLSTLVEECCGDVVQCDVVPDVPTQVTAALRNAFGNADIVITSGGASSGPRDFVKASLESLGTEFLFRSVAMRPGRPMAFGTRHGTIVAVLPGNPAAAFVGFVELVRPALLRLAGLLQTRLACVAAEIREGKAKGKIDRSTFLFASVAFDATKTNPVLTLLANQCSSLTRTAAAANSLVVLPSTSQTYGCGDVVQADILPWAI